MKKRINKILWYGDELEGGKAKAPSVSIEENGLDGLNEGELYISNNEEDPALFTRTSNKKIVRLGEGNYKPFKFVYNEELDALHLFRTDGKPAHFLATGALSTRALGNVEDEGTGSGMDYVYNVDDFAKSLDSFNKVSETDTFNAYAIRSLYEMVKNIENSSTDTSYVDGKIEEVNKKIDTNTAYLSEWIERVEDTLQENIDTVAGDLSTLQTTVNDFLTGTDTDTIINRWKELESFLNGYTETATLADLLSVKADKATTLAGYGITNAYTKTEVDNKITSVNTGLTTLQTTVSGHTTSIANLQSTVSGHTSSITSINGKITTLQGYFTNGVANSALRLSDSAEYKAWGQVFFKDGKPVNVSGAATFTQVNADSVVFGDKARLAYDSTLNALLLTRDDGTAVHFLASGAVSTRGLGDLSDSDTGGTGTGVDLLNVPSDIIPSVGATYSLGSSDNFWKMIYANGGIIGSTYIASDRVVFGTYIQGQSWVINPDGSAILGSITSNGATVATQNWVNSQLSSYVTTSALSSYATNEALSSESAARRGSTLSGAQLPNGQGYSVTWQTSQAGAQTVTIPTFGSLGYESIDDYYNKNGQESFLVDGVLMDSLLIYIEDAISAGGNVDLSGYVLKEGGTINNPTLTGDVVGNGWSIEGGISYLNEVNASSLYVNDVAVTPSNYVTLNSEQTISGKKTFTGGITANNGITASHIYSVEYIDSSALTINAETINLTYDGDDADLQVGLINGYKPLTLGNTSFAPSLTNGTVIGTITIGGESKTIYAPSGSNVDLSNYVTLNGEQTITGAKTFSNLLSDKITLQGFELTPYNPNGGTPDRLMYDGYVLLDEYNFGEYLDSSYVKKAGDTITGQLGFSGSTYPHIYGNGSFLVLSPASDGLYGLTFDKSSASIRARANNNTVLGSSSVRWSNVYSVLGNFSGQITSTVADGTAPFVVASKTLVRNLNTELWGGQKRLYTSMADSSITLLKVLSFTVNAQYTNTPMSFRYFGGTSGKGTTGVGTVTMQMSGAKISGVFVTGDEVLANKFSLYRISTTETTNDDGTVTSRKCEYELYVNIGTYGSLNVSDVKVSQDVSNLNIYANTYVEVALPTTYESLIQSSIGSVYGTATKLTTARTLWGNSFDGSGNVSGNLTGVETIIGSGLLGLVSTNNDIYLRRNGTDTTSLALNASAFKPFDVANGLLNLGSTSARWKVIYGQTLDLSDNATLKGTLTSGTLLPTTHQGASIGQTAQRWANGYFTSILSIGAANSTPISGPNTQVGVGYLELSGNTPYIDFHYNKSTSDYTSRIIESESGVLSVNAVKHQSGNILPNSSGAGSVGTSSSKWLNGYIDNLYSEVVSTNVLTSSTSPYLEVTAASLDLMSCELYGYDDNSLDVWSIDFGGNAYFLTVTQTSDVNYKNILSNVHLDLSDIAGAPTFRFTWVNENDGKIHLGTSAQYWQEIASELVVANKKTGKLGLDYSTAALVSAISIAREVNTMKMWQTSTTDKLAELEDRVKALEAENKELRELLDNK